MAQWNHLRTVALVWTIAASGLLTASGMAQPGKDKDPLSWDRNVSALFARHCYLCHRQDEASGDVDLAADVDVRQLVSHRAQWLRVLTMLESKQMPPEDARELSDENRQLMIDFLKQTLTDVDCESLRDPGRSVLRRLNRTEYDHVVLDLTGLNLRLADSFPPDPVSYGFDNIGEALPLTPAQVEVYHTAAKSIVEAVLAAEQNPLRAALEAVDSREAAGEVLQRFADAAFRQPAGPEYVSRLLQIYDLALAHGEASPPALGHALTAVLISPNFLMRVEREQVGADEFYAVSDHELASRLSFFLWSRGPDAELLQVAQQGQLHDPSILRQQVVRMLADARSGALVDNFFAQWLDLGGLASHTPDPSIYPDFNAELREAMLAEVRLLLAELVQGDGSLTLLIDADFGFLNQRLADHYGLPLGEGPPRDNGFVRTTFESRQRGGLLTSAAFLMAQSDPGRTNIPRRGNFIAGQLLGDAPPPPPPGVPPLELSNDGRPRSLRETFELHRSSEDCKSCHAKIDPMGFALENYDAVGRFRTEDRGVPIDATAELPGEEAFLGVVGLKDYLLREQKAILRVAATKLMIYGLGRGLQSSDECVLQDMLAAAEKSELKFSSLVSELVVSLPFTHRRSASY